MQTSTPQLEDTGAIVERDENSAVISVIAPTSFSDRDIALLCNITSLEHLHLQGSAVTDMGIQALHSLPASSSINLSDTSTSDQTLQELQKFSNLSHVSVNDTNVTDDGIQHLVGLKHLTSLDVGPNISDKGLSVVKEMKQLETLTIRGRSFTMVGIDDLRAARPELTVEHEILPSE